MIHLTKLLLHKPLTFLLVIPLLFSCQTQSVFKTAKQRGIELGMFGVSSQNQRIRPLSTPVLTEPIRVDFSIQQFGWSNLYSAWKYTNGQDISIREVIRDTMRKKNRYVELTLWDKANWVYQINRKENKYLRDQLQGNKHTKVIMKIHLATSDSNLNKLSKAEKLFLISHGQINENELSLLIVNPSTKLDTLHFSQTHVFRYYTEKLCWELNKGNIELGSTQPTMLFCPKGTSPNAKRLNKKFDTF